MTNTDVNSSSGADATAHGPGPLDPTDPSDPRVGFAAVTATVGPLIEAAEAMEPSVLNDPTPCSDFSVSHLMDHVVMVMRRVAVIGAGGHFSEVDQDELGSGWAEAWWAAAHQVKEAWTDSSKLDAVYEVPWGQIPGSPMLFTYTAELAVHGWDLATATGQSLSIDDDTLRGALAAMQFVPAEGRNAPEVPFGPVVEVGPDAPVLLQLAGWAGRDAA